MDQYCQNGFFDGFLDNFEKPEQWVNVSYHNDVCPSFECNGYQIFVDHPNPEERELGKETTRYCIIISLEYGDTGWTFQTDDLDEVLKEIEVPYLTRPLRYDKEEYLKEEARRAARI